MHEDTGRIYHNPIKYMVDAIDAAASIEEMKAVVYKLPMLIRILVHSGGKLSLINRLVTEVADSVTRKIAGILQLELGAPPVPFAFICMGSQGRGEQTLVTDQDNAIIYADPQDLEAEKVSAYFLNFGERMNRMLAQMGYLLCKGSVMAGNPKWNQPLLQWKHYFHQWILTPDPQNLLDISIFFDFRCVYGDTSIADELRRSVNASLAKNPAFFGIMAKLCVNYKVPLGMFGKIQTESKENQENAINIKNAIRVIVNMVRLYAMRQQIDDTPTRKRLNGLFTGNVISSAVYADISYAFEYMSVLQFRHQTQQFGEDLPMDNYVDLTAMPGIEIEMLKTVLSKLNGFQTKIKYDFGLSGN
jgi:CBS domain-containing protein